MKSNPDKDELQDLRRKIESLTLNLLDSYEELDLIYRSAERVLSTIDIFCQLDQIVQEATEIFEADWSWIYLENSPTHSHIITGGASVPSFLPVLHEKIVKGVLEKGVSCSIADLGREMPEGIGAPTGMYCQILKDEQEILGVLCVGRSQPERFFTSGEVKLANVLGTMASLALQNDSLHRKRREEEQALFRMQEEMRLASRIQCDLLPHSPPDIPCYDIAGKTQPARMVGGDYFDFISLGGNRQAIALGDVVGKGLPASLLMANLQATIRGQALLAPSVRDTLRMSNKLLFASTNDARFVTLIYGVLDIVSHQFSYCNGGHDPPLLFPLSGKPRELATGGLLLGVMENAVYQEETIPMQPGDLLLLYSDGITEGHDRNDKEFGVEALIDLVQQNRDLTADALIKRTFTSVHNHCGSDAQQDDQTLIVIKRTN